MYERGVFVSMSQVRKSAAEKARAWRARNPKTQEQKAAHAARERARYQNDEVYRNRQKELAREKRRDPAFRAKKRAYNKEWTKTRKYGLEAGDFQKIMESQEGCCALCSKTLDNSDRGHQPHIDHCHVTGRVRGILCLSCNTSLHLLDKVPISRILSYLGRTESTLQENSSELR